MSLSSIWTAVSAWLTGAEQWLLALFSKLVREEQELIPVVESFIQKAEAFLNNPTVVTILGLIPDGVGTEIESIFNEVAAFILAELTAIAPTLAVASTSNNGTPVYANQDAIAKTVFQSVSQLSTDGQKNFLSGYGIRLLQSFSPSGANTSYEEAQLALSISKAALTSGKAA